MIAVSAAMDPPEEGLSRTTAGHRKKTRHHVENFVQFGSLWNLLGLFSCKAVAFSVECSHYSNDSHLRGDREHCMAVLVTTTNMSLRGTAVTHATRYRAGFTHPTYDPSLYNLKAWY